MFVGSAKELKIIVASSAHASNVPSFFVFPCAQPLYDYYSMWESPNFFHEMSHYERKHE